MKFIVLLCVFAMAAASPAPQKPSSEVKVLRDDREVLADGYKFSFETDDGYKRSEEGRATAPEGALAITGQYEFRLPDGQIFVLKFIADENGYRAESPFLPVLSRK